MIQVSLGQVAEAVLTALAKELASALMKLVEQEIRRRSKGGRR